MKKILIVVGTRPEAIKMAPVYHQLKRSPSLEAKLCVTGQHREMLDQVLSIFGISADFDLNIMHSSQSLCDALATMIKRLPDIYNEYRPDWILVHGDTATTLAASVAAFYSNIKIGHVEAGLRTHNLQFPWPEEGNRRLTSVIADLHFCPTENSANNLLREGVDRCSVHITGNTVVDALKITLEQHIIGKERHDFLDNIEPRIKHFSKYILVTCHRRENFGLGIKNICNAIKLIANKNKNIGIVFATHLNPKVKVPIHEMLQNINNIILVPPLNYIEFTGLMYHSHFIITDSGGIQEEGPSIGKPVLVMRDVTERPEAVVSGTVKLIGQELNEIVQQVTNLLNDKANYALMAEAKNPYGDGTASLKILDIILRQ